ncbi:hypothetical protein AB0F57_10385 [Streptomyces tanashiensis]|uniref:hypothetical protein n=1 Tax=Streptomyces tanashiensis TaxID=67367 RepID=UPI0033D287CD
MSAAADDPILNVAVAPCGMENRLSLFQHAIRRFGTHLDRLVLGFNAERSWAEAEKSCRMQ